MSKFTIWSLKKGEDRRIRGGHPWIFSNQLAHSPKGVVPGSWVQLYSEQNEILATGYGNPNSLIAFRAIEFGSVFEGSQQCLVDRILQAWQRRVQMGFSGSYRIVFSEADFLPGLVLDYYRSPEFQVLAFQILTSGMENWISEPEKVFSDVIERAKTEGMTDWGMDKTFLVVRKDASIRKLEGLTVEEPRCLVSPPHRNPLELKNAKVQVAALTEGSVNLRADLLNGQKTGFFLDQSLNMQLVAMVIRSRKYTRKVRVLDLCCYVGHWSLQLASLFKTMGIQVEVCLVDVSADALKRASQSMEESSIHYQAFVVDVMAETEKWPSGPFDVLIVDPPAFAKSRKDIGAGERAYLKLNTQAFRHAHAGSLVISCSCSGLVEEVRFNDLLGQALRKSGRSGATLLRGGQGFDHPVMPTFPEGKYLKMTLTEVW